MTYTFKLARRLAVSRDFAMIAVLALLVACMDDSTGPAGEPTRAPNPGFLQVFPRAVTVETNQSIRFRGESRTSRGDIVAVPIAWQVSEGGVIRSDGTFSSAAVGTFKVVGRAHRWSKADTSSVIVVPPQVNLKTVTVEPDSVSLAPGDTQVFRVSARLNNGAKGAAGVVWSASGGLIDPDGSYRAGANPGTYQVIAANTQGTIADTADVIITELPATEPPGDPDPTPVTLASVVVNPGNVSLTTGGARQFKAFGRSSDGDSVSVTATFRATGGTITSGGLYTAGPSAGTYKVIAASEGLADTALVTLTGTTSGGDGGIPFGPFASWSSATTLKSNTSLFTLDHSAVLATNILDRIASARANKIRLVLAMTAGHTPFLTDGVFDRSKWDARMDTYKTATIKEAIAKGVADGTIVGAQVMDEPNVSGLGDGNTWGPKGTMNKARVDSLCGYVKAIFPTLPAGVVVRASWEPTERFRVCDFIVHQYSNRFGDVAADRDLALELGRRDGHAVMFSMNILNGGIQAPRDGLWNCPLSTTGGRGTYDPNCRMTPEQLRQYALVLGPAGCGLLMWRYDEGFMANSENQRALSDVATRLKALPSKSCRRP